MTMRARLLDRSPPGTTYPYIAVVQSGGLALSRLLFQSAIPEQMAYDYKLRIHTESQVCAAPNI